jgi:hypothetical protein
LKKSADAGKTGAMSRLEAAGHPRSDQIPAGSLRHNLLLTAQRFKSIWFEFGALLVRARDEASYEEWGYPTFEDYCRKELRIRRQTAFKLTRSYSFLSRHEPKAALSQEMSRRAPRFEVVEVLAEAEERGKLSPEEYKEIRDSIWSSDKPVSELKREFSERFPGIASSNQARPQPQRLAYASRKLADGLAACRHAPRAIVERAAALAEDVEDWARAAEKR